MLEHYVKAARDLNLDLNKIYAECIASSLEYEKQEQLKRVKKKMRKEMK